MNADKPAEPVATNVIIPLSSAAATLGRAGGKGANLSALARAGFEVPPGFVVTTDAYRAFVAANRLGPRLLGLAEGVSPDEPSALEAASADIRALFAHGVMPAGIAASIGATYARLSPAGGGYLPVAVRSSATAEDLPGLSFAGQQDTYLNIIGPDALIEAVRSCWGSLWTARAMAYRARNRVAPDDLALAVVVQSMVPSEVSGVLFTANPLTGHRGEMVIDASYGLGEAIVSGQVEPDHYVVDRHEMRVTSRRLGAKALAILPRREGGTRRVSQGSREQQALPDAQILDLARTCARVADHFGSPQDIEWAWAEGRLYLLQSRPTTSLYPMPESLLHSRSLRVLFSLNSIQGLVEPFTPIGRDLLPLLFTSTLRTLGVRPAVREVVVDAGGRLFIDVTVPASDRRLRRALLGVLANGDPGAREIVLGLIADGRIETAAIVGLGRILRMLVGFRLVIARMLMTWLRPERMRERAVRRAERYTAQVRKAIRGATSLEACLALIDQYAPRVFEEVLWAIGPAMIPGLMALGMVSRWLTVWAGAEPGAVGQLVRGLPGNVTTEMDLRLWAAAQAIRSDAEAAVALRGRPVDAIARAYQDGELPTAAQAAIRAFLDEYGMRAVGEVDMGKPRWREDPRSIIQNLCGYLEIDDPSLAPDRLFRMAGAEAAKLSAEYVEQVRKGRGRLHAHLLRAAIRRMRLLGGLRELPKFCVIRILDAVRTALLAAGRELAAEGKLDRAEDVFFVPLDALRAAAKGDCGDLQAIVRRERTEYSRELARRQVPRLLLNTGEAFYQGMRPAEVGDLVGDGVSPGAVEGRVRVVLDPRSVRLEPGEILVCPATDPGWTPLFLSAGGLVMELGGMVTHGSVVAREYGIPAVVGVHEATTRLKTGQMVRVDGSAGRVVVLERTGEAPA